MRSARSGLRPEIRQYAGFPFDLEKIRFFVPPPDRLRTESHFPERRPGPPEAVRTRGSHRESRTWIKIHSPHFCSTARPAVPVSIHRRSNPEARKDGRSKFPNKV